MLCQEPAAAGQLFLIGGGSWRTTCCCEEPVVFILAQHPPRSSWKRKPVSSCPSPCQHASSSVESNPTSPYSPSQRAVAWPHIWPWVAKLSFHFTSIKLLNENRKIIAIIIVVYRLQIQTLQKIQVSVVGGKCWREALGTQTQTFINISSKNTTCSRLSLAFCALTEQSN